MSQQSTDSTLAPAFFHIATQCGSVLKVFCRGKPKEAKKSLQRLAQEHPNSFLPHRYLVRGVPLGFGWGLKAANLRGSDDID